MRYCRITIHHKVQMLLFAPLFFSILVGASLTSMLPRAVDTDDGGAMGVLRRKAYNSPPLEDYFTIVIQTYDRTDILFKLLNHYQAAPHLKQIVIVWNNVEKFPPRELWDSLGPHPVPVVFKEQDINLVRNRLQPLTEIDTDAVLMVDDTLISVPDIIFAFSVWKQFTDQIVGFAPRKHVTTASGVYSYGSSELQDTETGGGDRYSMIMIGASFLHRRYLQLFQDQPWQVHALVDITQNCDDIAMNFVVSLALARADGAQARPSGVFVKPVDVRNLEKGASSGMWNPPEHMLQRSYCLNRLAQIYGHMPLRYSNIMITQFGFPSYARSKM